MNQKTSISKQNFLQGAAILTLGAIFSKIIGAMFKIPLARLITTEGVGHFSIAYNIYIVLLNISSTGLPVAVSRLISEANTLKDTGRIKQIHRISLMLFVFIGVVSSGAMLAFAPQIARWMRDADAVYAIAVLAPAVLFVCISSAFRGYFQGQQYMTPTASAQVIEAFCKLFIGLLAAKLALGAGWSYPKAAGAAILGVTVGAILGSVYFAWVYRKKPICAEEAEVKRKLPSRKQTAWSILALAIPITISATGFQVFNVLCSKVIMGRLQDALLLPLDQASSLLGIYTNTQTLYLLPSALVQSIAVSIVPAITESLYSDGGTKCRKKTESAIRVVGLVAIPCGVGLSILAAPIQRILYGYDAQTNAIAGPLLTILGLTAILYCFILVTNAILQAHGKVSVAIYTTLAGGIANLVTTYILVGNPKVGIYGAAVGTTVYCLVAVIINVLAIKHVAKPTRFLPQLWKTAVAAALMAAAAAGVYSFTHNVIIAMAAAGIVYTAAVYGMKVLTWYDCCLFSKGEKIAKVLRIPKTDE